MHDLDNKLYDKYDFSYFSFELSLAVQVKYNYYYQEKNTLWQIATLHTDDKMQKWE